MKFLAIFSSALLPALAFAEGDTTTTCTSTMTMTKTVTLTREHTTSMYLNSTTSAIQTPAGTGSSSVVIPQTTTTTAASVPTGAAPNLLVQSYVVGGVGLAALLAVL